MANNNKKTYIIGHPGLVNDCNKICVCNSSVFDLPLSLYTISEIYKDLGDDKVEIDREDDKFVYNPNVESLKKSGFDVIIYLASGGDVLGYTKFDNPQATLGRTATITLNIGENLEDDYNLEVSYQLVNIVTDGMEKSKYSSHLATVEEAKNTEIDKRLPFSSHLESGDNIFLGKETVLATGEMIGLGILYGSIPNPYPETKFSQYLISYYENSDLCLGSWGSDEDGKYYYSIVSLMIKDQWKENPKSYVITKEGRKPAPMYLNKDTEIVYISGRYLVCSIPDLGLRVYDTVREKWITSGETVLSNAFMTGNKIYTLPSKRLLRSELIRVVPEVARVFIPKDVGSALLKLSGVFGGWCLFSVPGKGNEQIYVVCGSTFALCLKKDEFKNLMFLNDLTLVMKTDDGGYNFYYGTGETFGTTAAKESLEGKWKEKIETIAPRSGENFWEAFKDYRRMYKFPKSEDIEMITTFSGLVFYKENRKLYYL